jgi:predicted phage baseplate assembly protein
MTNPPGLDAIAYRSGTHGSVLSRMLDALGSRLGRLDATASDDPAVALLDAWATVADVVTFYQERIANEGFLRTAVERRSVLELARQIGYELRPGAAATTYLDFRLQGAPATSVVPAGTRVLSVPAQGQLPQAFETATELLADVARNETAVRTRRPQRLAPGRTELYLAGVRTGLQRGDPILVVEGPAAAAGEFRVLSSVVPQPAAAVTLVTWADELTGDYQQPEVHAFAVRTALFGFNAPDWRGLPAEVRDRYQPTSVEQIAADWPGFTLPDGEQGDNRAVDLDGVHPGVAAGGLLVLRQPGTTRLYHVLDAQPSARHDFLLSAKTTRVTMTGPELTGLGRLAATAYAASHRLDLADEPVPSPVSGRVLDLTQAMPLADGQPVIVYGTAAGRPWSAVTLVDDVQGTLVTLADPVPELDRESVRLAGNVVLATHGETVPDEVLGSGDGTAPNQRFALRKPDLTHLAARTPTGVADSLTVRVDGVAWTEVPALLSAGPLDRAYVVRIDDDAVATVIFGDGVHGARLPTGPENVHARYRSGIGPAGEVGAHALSLLPQRPLGVTTVDNPLPASGAAAPETLAGARTNAPLTVLTLDRVVSLSDYEDYARAFGGIAKARAVALPAGGTTLVQITVAGAGGAAVAEHPTIELLRGALDTVRDVAVPVRVDSFRPIPFRLAVEVLADPDRIAADVYAAVAGALRDFYAADRRDFGRPVTTAEVLAAVQRVIGVQAARITELRADPAGRPVTPALRAPEAHWDPAHPGDLIPAGLLLLADGEPHVTAMTP